MIKIVVPYPPSSLNPNARLHWSKKVKIKNAQKNIGYTKALLHSGRFGAQDIALSLMFFASSKRPYDLDNALASCKSVLDGIALGLNVDDKQFKPVTIQRGNPDKKNPRVEITLDGNKP